MQAYRITRDSRWRSQAWWAFNWFLGDNDLQLPLFDSITGGCRDGLHPDRANENNGGESVVSYLLALAEMRRLSRFAGNYVKPAQLRLLPAQVH